MYVYLPKCSNLYNIHANNSIAKALELFLGLIVDEASKVTLERNSKRVEAYHLWVNMCLYRLVTDAETQLWMGLICHRKHAIERTDMLDFLKEIVAAVPDPSAGGTIDLEAEKAERGRRRGPPRKRRKKGEPEAEEPVDESGWAKTGGAGTEGEDEGGQEAESDNDWD